MEHRAQVFGHRGSRATHPENTIAAFQHAIDSGADGIELDIAVSRDGVLVVTHDLVHGGMAIRDRDWAHWGARMPRLEQVLALKAGRPFVFDIEMKSDKRHRNRTPAPDEFAALALGAIENAGVHAESIVRSFDFELLRAVRRADSNIRLATLYAYLSKTALHEAVELGAPIVSPEKRLITPKLVRKAHLSGLQISAWTANSRNDWKRLTNLGVDMIITDDPAALVRYYACFSASGPMTGSTTD